MPRRLDSKSGGMDLFADALIEFRRTGRASLYTEFADGHREREDVSWYFTRYAEFPRYEKDALKCARGRVLDIGCGAGRHSLYLQRRGLTVTGIDSSAALVQLARARGVKDVRVANVCGPLPFEDGTFHTIVLFGNNLGLCGTVRGFRRMLRELSRVTSSRGRILGTTRLPPKESTQERGHIRTRRQNQSRVGQVSLRLHHRQKAGPWFDLLLFAPEELAEIVGKEGWRVTQQFGKKPTDGYAVVLEKRSQPKKSRRG